MSAEMLQNHLNSLADALCCELRQPSSYTPGMMYVEFGYVEGPSLAGEFGYGGSIEARYMVNMHELGHFACGHTQGRPPMQNKKWYFDNGVLNSEAEAWAWALDNSLLKKYSKSTRDFMWYTCLNSYLSGARDFGFGRPGARLFNGDRHHVSFAWDVPDNHFWKVKERLLAEVSIS